MNTKISIPVKRFIEKTTIGIFSPSEPIVGNREEKFRNGLSILQKHGFQTKLAKNSLIKTGYMAGSIQNRIDDIYELINDINVGALITSWGGKSCNQLIKNLDFEKIAQARKPIMGFSDGDVLLNAITAHTGLITFHGPNVVGKLDETQHSDLSFFQRNLNNYNILGETAHEVASTIRSGKITGKLFGGNLSTFVLSMIHSVISEEYWEGGIFFWEETSLPPQLIDQYLTGLKNTGFLDRLGGMVIGQFIYDDPVNWKQMDGLLAIKQILSKYNYPILYCPTFGHSKLENPIIPIGAICSLDTHKAELQLVESVLE